MTKQSCCSSCNSGIVNILQVDSVPQALEAGFECWQEMSIHDDRGIWFRGVPCSSYCLVPSAYRDDNYNEIKSFHEVCNYGARFKEFDTVDFWERYYAAQHFGLPTRLLDWSEGFMQSLFFALDGFVHDNSISTCPAIWILNPYGLNQILHNTRQLYRPNFDSSVGAWELDEFRAAGLSLPVRPVAIQPIRKNDRIIAQLGAFTVHGSERSCLANQISSLNKKVVPRDILRRIDLVRIGKPEAVAWLRIIGATRASVYPDLPNFILSLRSPFSI